MKFTTISNITNITKYDVTADTAYAVLRFEKWPSMNFSIYGVASVDKNPLKIQAKIPSNAREKPLLSPNPVDANIITI
jgi:hypothetical protein